MGQLNPKVDGYIARSERWGAELRALRAVILEHELVEELKWGVPCYTLGSRNVALMHVFKDYCAILFVKGALLDDAQGVLVQQTKNVQSARQVRFTAVREVVGRRVVLRRLLDEAIAAERAGLKVAFKAVAEFAVPAEFRAKLDEDPALRAAFDALTPGRRRAYLLHFAAAKQSKTRSSRVDRCVGQILRGKGLDDR